MAWLQVLKCGAVLSIYPSKTGGAPPLQFISGNKLARVTIRDTRTHEGKNLCLATAYHACR